MGIGMLSALLGLIVVIPLLGHASWHAYRDLTGRPPVARAVPDQSATRG
jgi:uncharacterized membrane protein